MDNENFLKKSWEFNFF